MKYIQIITIIVFVFLFVCVLRKKESFTKMNVCIKKYYSSLSQPFPYISCEDYGYVVPKDYPLSTPIKMWKCKIGLPAHSIKYKIFDDDIARYSMLMKPHDFGPVIGEYMKFDNGEEYQLIK